MKGFPIVIGCRGEFFRQADDIVTLPPRLQIRDPMYAVTVLTFPRAGPHGARHMSHIDVADMVLYHNEWRKPT